MDTFNTVHNAILSPYAMKLSNFVVVNSFPVYISHMFVFVVMLIGPVDCLEYSSPCL